MRKIYFIGLLFIVVILITPACGPAEGNYTGREYMMDMGHSIAYESNVSNYYSYNRFTGEEEYHTMVQPRLPQNGTIPRGYAGLSNPSDATVMADFKSDFQGFPINGSVPYYYEDTPEDRIRATAEIIKNPFPITDKGLAKGKELYDIFCATCHGEKGDGLGYLVRDDGGKYPAAPANLVSDDFIAASNGRIYHSIMHGLNVMGSYADKLSYEERWQVIHYIRALQASSKTLQYSEAANTLNNHAVPGASLQKADTTATSK